MFNKYVGFRLVYTHTEAVTHFQSLMESIVKIIECGPILC